MQSHSSRSWSVAYALESMFLPKSPPPPHPQMLYLHNPSKEMAAKGAVGIRHGALHEQDGCWEVPSLGPTRALLSFCLILSGIPACPALCHLPGPRVRPVLLQRGAGECPNGQVLSRSCLSCPAKLKCRGPRSLQTEGFWKLLCSTLPPRAMWSIDTSLIEQKHP